MGMHIWYGQGEDNAISLGSIFIVFPAFAEISKVLQGLTGFEELESIPGFAEQEVSSWWINEVKHQAELFLSNYSNLVSMRTILTLENLIKEIEETDVSKLPHVGSSPLMRVKRFTGVEVDRSYPKPRTVCFWEGSRISCPKKVKQEIKVEPPEEN